MAKITYEIDRKDFERFLAENPERVFDQNSIEHCAIAEYLISTGLHNPGVLGGYANFGETIPRTRITLPQWAQGVAAMKTPDTHPSKPYPFTARQILDFLATLPEDSHEA
jgi:hypothetical protein